MTNDINKIYKFSLGKEVNDLSPILLFSLLDSILVNVQLQIEAGKKPKDIKFEAGWTDESFEEILTSMEVEFGKKVADKARESIKQLKKLGYLEDITNSPNMETPIFIFNRAKQLLNEKEKNA